MLGAAEVRPGPRALVSGVLYDLTALRSAEPLRDLGQTERMYQSASNRLKAHLFARAAGWAAAPAIIALDETFPVGTLGPRRAGGRRKKDVSVSVHVVFGSGPVGRATSRALLRRGFEVRLVNRRGRDALGPDAAAFADVEVLTGDATDAEFSTRAAADAERCVSDPQSGVLPLGRRFSATATRGAGRRTGDRGPVREHGQRVFVRPPERSSTRRTHTRAPTHQEGADPPSDGTGGVGGSRGRTSPGSVRTSIGLLRPGRRSRLTAR